MSGHNKWGQIKHKKAITDAKKGQLFSKLIKEIVVAVKVGGADPKTNTRLRTAMEHAQTVNLSKDNIDRAILRASGEGKEATLTEFLYEASGSGGAAILIEGITDSKNRTVAEIKHLLSEHGGKLAEQGSLLWNFEKIGIISINPARNFSKTKEEIALALIEAGAKDFKIEEEEIIGETLFQEKEHIRMLLEQFGIVVDEIYHNYKALNPVSPSPEDLAKTETLIEALLDHDDVQEIYTNIIQQP